MNILNIDRNRIMDINNSNTFLGMSIFWFCKESLESNTRDNMYLYFIYASTICNKKLNTERS